MPEIKNTDIAEIAQAVEDKLVAKLVVDDRSQIVWSIDEFPEHVKGDYDIVLHIAREQNVDSQSSGGGRLATWASRIVDLFVRTSFAGTPLGNDKEKIKKHVRVERRLLDALDGKWLDDADQNQLLTKPINWLGATPGTRELRKPAKNLWMHTGFSFEFHYRPLINPSDYT